MTCALIPHRSLRQTPPSWRIPEFMDQGCELAHKISTRESSALCFYGFADCRWRRSKEVAVVHAEVELGSPAEAAAQWHFSRSIRARQDRARPISACLLDGS